MRSCEAEGNLETSDRMRSIGEQICDYADVEGDGYNPFRSPAEACPDFIR
jgi:hypothetical protein